MSAMVRESPTLKAEDSLAPTFPAMSSSSSFTLPAIKALHFSNYCCSSCRHGWRSRFRRRAQKFSVSFFRSNGVRDKEAIQRGGQSGGGEGVLSAEIDGRDWYNVSFVYYWRFRVGCRRDGVGRRIGNDAVTAAGTDEIVATVIAAN